MGRFIDAVTFGRRRRRWDIERRLRVLDRLDAADRAAAPAPRRRRSGWTPVVAIWVAVGVVVLVAPSLPRSALPELTWFGADAAGADDTAGAVAADAGYAFMATQRDGTSPITWDTCEPIGYETSGRAPVGGEDLVAEAFAEVERATGLVFVDEGATDRRPRPQRRTWVPTVESDADRPVLVSWTSPERVPGLEGSVIGLGGPQGTAGPFGRTVWTSGSVTLDRPAFADLLRHDRSPGVRDRLRAVVVHEVGHLLGLDHVADPAQLMHASSGAPRLGAGDLAGLARVAPRCTD